MKRRKLSIYKPSSSSSNRGRQRPWLDNGIVHADQITRQLNKETTSVLLIAMFTGFSCCLCEQRRLFSGCSNVEMLIDAGFELQAQRCEIPTRFRSNRPKAFDGTNTFECNE